MKKSVIIERLLEPGVIAIIRADSSEQLVEVSEALLEGGITAIEVTMTTPNALEVIRTVSRKFGERVLTGVGTVLDAATAEEAVEAGARFIVSPVLKVGLIQTCNRLGVPIAAGAYSPTEAQTAHESGADFIKIFPADGVGPGYIKAIRAPLPHLRIIPTGGVDVSTCASFIRAGCVAVAAGSSLVSREILKSRDWSRLTDLARQFVANVAGARAEK